MNDLFELNASFQCPNCEGLVSRRMIKEDMTVATLLPTQTKRAWAVACVHCKAFHTITIFTQGGK
jgi:hypothetical protein